MRVSSGIDVLAAGGRPDLRPLPAGLIVHPASVTRDLVSSVDALRSVGFDIRALFGPQHGAMGDKQDNMIESGHSVDRRTGLPVHSLYSEVRKPTPAMLEGLEALIFDLQDVGVRVYTFVWTMALAMEACAEAGVKFVVLDRPNPVGGTILEGPVLKPEYRSFVGLYSIPLRHGLTAGELAGYLNGVHGIGCDLEVIPCEGWLREMWWDQTGLPFVLPSPNLPTLDSCIVYPGMVLVEGTELSEGRGTTRPFEFCGAPYLDPHALVDRMGDFDLPGVRFRPSSFEPTFQKYAERLCHGVQLHVTDRETFRSVESTVALFRAVRDLGGDEFSWRLPPYEYEEVLMPVDILWGHDGLRTGIDSGSSPAEILESVPGELDTFRAAVAPYLLYG
ncbi:MAG: DUF1343 domain-containing protein [Gemmatimonadota bacterium]|nr:DUF1343 domain-containing protein [Gemmatimonadota bacterium]